MNPRKLLLLLLLPLVANAQDFVIEGARVHTVGPQGTLDNASILVRDGMIAAVGTDIDVPGGTETIDASGKVVTPGLFSPLGQIGLTEVNVVRGTVDYVQRGEDFAAAFDIADAYNRRSTVVAVNRIEGITRAAITPRGAAPDEFGNVSHVLAGLGAIVNLGDDDAPVTKRRAMLVAHFGEGGGSLAGGSRAAALLAFRTALDDAQDFAEHRDAYDSGARRAYSVSRADLEALQPVLNAAIPVLAYVDRASDIRTLLAIAAEYGLRLVIAGGAEAWMLADELAAADVAVILSAFDNLPGSFDQLNARIDSAALLEAAGVSFAFGGNRNTQNHNARNITQAAGVAVANGLSWEAALRAITRAPAEFYGVADRLGSVEAGKAADLVIWPDDPLELTSFPEQVIIDGVAVPMESRQTLLRDRYLRSDSNLPPAFRR